LLNPYEAFEVARHSFEEARAAAAAAEMSAAVAQFGEAVGHAGVVWREDAFPTEVRTQAARLAADAAYSQGIAAAQLGASTEALHRATVLCAEIHATEDLEDDVRLHGLYRAQCAAFELAHALRHASPERAIELFRDAVICADAARDFPPKAVDKEKILRTLANASAAALVLATTLRDVGDTRYKSDLIRARDLGKEVLELGGLTPSLEVEAMLVMGEIHFELAQVEDEPEKAVEHLENALGWTREASQSPGADGVLQAQAFQRGANYACVYGLYVRNEDFEKGIGSLEGAVQLAMAATGEAAPPEIRAGAWDAAVRTQQNIGLLWKERDPATAAVAFKRAAGLAAQAVADAQLSESHVAQHMYLRANAQLEGAILAQFLGGAEDAPDALAAFTACAKSVEEVLSRDTAPADIRARAALLGCGAWGRRGRATGEVACQESIVRLGAIAAATEGADPENRARGASFSAQARAVLEGL
jgi:hypothetical protein